MNRRTLLKSLLGLTVSAALPCSRVFASDRIEQWAAIDTVHDSILFERTTITYFVRVIKSDGAVSPWKKVEQEVPTELPWGNLMKIEVRRDKVLDYHEPHESRVPHPERRKRKDCC